MGLLSVAEIIVKYLRGPLGLFFKQLVDYGADYHIDPFYFKMLRHVLSKQFDIIISSLFFLLLARQTRYLNLVS